MDVVGHVAVRLRNHGRPAAEDVIAGKQVLDFRLVKAAMARFVPRRVHDADFAAVVRDLVAFAVGEILAAEIARAQPRDAELRPGALLQRQRAAAMIAVNVRQKNFLDFFSAHRLGLLDDAVDVASRRQRHVDDGNFILAEQVLVRAFERHQAGIGRGEILNRRHAAR
jgi:hypothetical protein